MSIRYKLTFIILALVSIPLLFVSIITFSNYQKSLESARLSQVQELARYRVDKIETYFTTVRTEMEMTEGLYPVRKLLPDLSHGAHAVTARQGLDDVLMGMRGTLGLADILLTDNKGMVVYVNNAQHRAKEYSFPLEKLYPASFEKGKKGLFFSDIFFNNSVDSISEMLVAAPVFDLNNNIAGTIVFEINLQQLYRQIQDSTGLAKTDEVLVGKKVGNNVVFLHSLLFDSSHSISKQIPMGSSIGIPIQKAVSGGPGSGQYIDYRGKKVLAAWRPVPTPGWGLVAKIDCDEAFADIARLKQLVVVVVVFVFVLIAVITYLVAQSISQPIRKLTVGAEIIGHGNLDHSVGTKVKDEIGQLSRTFDKMTRALKETTASRDELNREIAERKNAEEALRNTADDLKRSNKDLEQFAYVASHDLQEPLRAVAGFMGLLKKLYGEKLNAEAAEFIDLSVEGAERMQTLIHDLLTFSRVGTKGGAFAPTAMKASLDNAIKNLNAAILETGTVVTADDLPTVIADATQMTQLLQNLIGNAIKFHGPKSPQIHVSAKKENNTWTFGVSDNGIGIEPQYYDRIFLIFQRLHTRTQFKGTGIGLAVCKKIIERHGGAMWVESKINEGSTFYFTMPDRDRFES